jgi:archaellin
MTTHLVALAAVVLVAAVAAGVHVALSGLDHIVIGGQLR